MQQRDILGYRVAGRVAFTELTIIREGHALDGI
jgi:hypothetical protein